MIQLNSSIYNQARHERLRERDGFDSLRFSKTQELSKYLQNLIETSQNPKSCENARILVRRKKHSIHGARSCAIDFQTESVLALNKKLNFTFSFLFSAKTLLV